MAKDGASKSRSTIIEAYSEKRGICITVIILGLIIGIFAFAYIAFGNDQQIDPQVAKSTVVLVSIISQHGSIAPLITYPTNPYKNDSIWPFGSGELTKKGRLNMYNLGKFLRDRYTGFLPELYYPKDVVTLSSDTNRCYMSAALLLAGLYVPHKFQLWNTHLMWQPIPVRMLPNSTDKMLDVKKNCLHLNNEFGLIERSVNNNQSVTEFYNYITKHANITSATNDSAISSLYQFYQLFSIQNAYNFELPKWTNSIFPGKLSQYALQNLQMYTKTLELRKLGTGVLLDDIVQHMILKTKNATTVPKLFLYSVNDVTIFKLLRALNVHIADTVIPDFGSTIMVELHNVTHNYHLEIYYLKKSTSKEPMPLNITGCESPCSLHTFTDLTKQLIPTSWEKECQL